MLAPPRVCPFFKAVAIDFCRRESISALVGWCRSLGLGWKSTHIELEKTAETYPGGPRAVDPVGEPSREVSASVAIEVQRTGETKDNFVIVSYQKVLRRRTWEKLDAQFKAKETLTAKVVDRTALRRGGATALRHDGSGFEQSAARPDEYDRPWAPRPPPPRSKRTAAPSAPGDEREATPPAPDIDAEP